MSLSFLPLPLYVLVCLTVSAYLVYTAISRRKKDSKGLIIVYLTVAAGIFLPLAKRLINEVFLKTDQWDDLFGYLSLGMVIIVALELTVVDIVHVRKGNRNKTKITQLIIVMLLIWSSIIFFVLILLHVIH